MRDVWATRTGEVAVAFAGAESGTAPLTWGQREIWAAMELQGRTLGMGGTMLMPPGTRIDDFVAVLRFALQRHQSLRTTFDCDAHGRPVAQRVAAGGEVLLDVFDVDDEDDPVAFAEALSTAYEEKPYDLADDWPVRMAVVRQDGVPTHAVVMYCHLVIDGFGLDALNRDLALLDRATGRAQRPAAGTQPLDQARQQASPEGLQQSETALRYWARLLPSVPAVPTVAAVPLNVGGAVQPRYWQARMISPAMWPALATISARTQVDSSPVLLAAFAVAMARVSGVSLRAVRAVVSNRFRPGLADSVSVVNQSGLCVIDTADVDFDEVVRRAWRASMGAGMHAYYDPHALHALLVAAGADRGEELDLGCFFNDSRRTRELAGAATVGRTVGSDALGLARSEFSWAYRRDIPNDRIFMAVSEAVDTVDFAICADTWYWPPTELESCARLVEQVVVEAATNPHTTTGVSSVAAVH